MGKNIEKFSQVGGLFFLMKRTVGSPEAWEFLAGTARFPSEMSENAPVFSSQSAIYTKSKQKGTFSMESRTLSWEQEENLKHKWENKLSKKRMWN